jgi:ParB family transcriptional regulator, chromosome partitioning protein
MNQKPHQRRGLGRGLGSLIPTAPRPDADDRHTDGHDDRQAERPDELTVRSSVATAPSRSGPADANGAGAAAPTGAAVPGTADPGVAGPGTADWIGVPLPGDTVAPTSTAWSAGTHPEAASAEPSSPAPGPAVTGSPPEDEPAPPSDGSGLQPVTGAWFAELPVDEIRPNPRQPREVFDEDAMAELVHSITEVGLLQPIVVRPVDQGRYELVMGERRWRAVQQAGIDTIPAIVRETGDDDLLRDALLENLHRSELNPLEEAAAYQQLLSDFGCTHDELAGRIGRSRPQISNTIRLLKLSPAVQRRVAAGVLSAGHARALLGVEDADVQDRLAGRVVAEGISVRGLEEIVAVGDVGPASVPARRNRPTAPGAEDLAERLSDRLETRVRVDLGRRKGRITVEFASLPDLERIVGLIDPGHPNRTRHDADHAEHPQE